MFPQELLDELAKDYTLKVCTPYHVQIEASHGMHNIYFSDRGKIKFHPYDQPASHPVTARELGAELTAYEYPNAEEPEAYDVVLSFGKHAGQRLLDVPASYLRWLVNTSGIDPKLRELAKAEYLRRGQVLPTLELSGHALDNASLRVRKIWHETALSQDEGLHSWLMRVTAEAIEKGERLPSGKIKYLKMKFVIEQGEVFPVLKTIAR
jgi:hypothetical protein